MLSPSIPDWLPALAQRAAAADGQPPFSDQSLVELAAGQRELVALGTDAAAIFAPESSEAEFVVDPDARRRGLGEILLAALLERTGGELRVWAHGDHPAARILAQRHGLAPARELLQLRAAVPDDAIPVPVPALPLTAAPFRPGIDDAAWLGLNAAAFASHPEQGGLSQSDLDARLAETWFDADDFLLLWSGDALVGFCWLKVDGGLGEFYAVGVDPTRQGEGLGRVLVATGFARLAARGIRMSNLYVEADNEPALRLYRSFGFADHSVDIQYSTGGILGKTG